MEVTEKHINICHETQTKGINSTSPSLCCSVIQLCPTLCDPMDCSMPGFPVLHHLLGLAQIISIDSVMPSNPPVLCRPLHLLLAIFSSIRVFSNELALPIWWPKYGVSASASVLPMNIQNWFPLGRTGWISLQSKGLSRVFSNTTVQKHQFFSAQLSSQSNSLTSVHDHWKNHSFDHMDLCWLVCFCFYFHYSRRWLIEHLALIYVIESSACVFL